MLFGVLCTMAMSPLADAQVVAAPGSGAQVVQTANGLQQVNIARPNSGSGVSINTYSQFSVSAQGTLLNNSPTITQTQQAGYINGNPNLLPGGSARVIVNQVTSTHPSTLAGYLEVAGPRAEVVVANPNGILVNGGGFINTSRAVLTTGTPVYGNGGSLDAFRVTGGQISIQGAGLNASNVDQVDLIARAVQANAAIYGGKQLNVVAGANQVDHGTLTPMPIVGTGTGTGATPALGIDVAQLGGMYAGKIFLASTENGVGVSLKGVTAAQAGDLTLTSQGKLILAGSTSATGNLTASAGAGIEHSGATYAQQAVSLSTSGDLINTGTLAAQQGLTVRANQVTSTGTLGAEINRDGTTANTGDLTVAARGTLAATGTNVAGGNATLQGSDVALAHSQTSANGKLAIQAHNTADLTGATTHAGAVAATAGSNFLHEGGQLFSQGATTIESGGALSNIQGTVQAGGALSIAAASVDNTAGRLTSLNGDGLTLATRGTLTNVAGTTAAGTQGGVIGGNGAVHLKSGTLVNRGQLSAAGDAVLQAGGLDNDHGTITAGGALAAAVTGTLSNQHGALTGESATVSASSVDNSAGVLGGHGDVTVNTQTLTNTGGGQLAAGGALALNTASQIDNRGGLIYGAKNLTLNQAGATLANDGGSLQGGQDATVNVASMTNASGNVRANRDVSVQGAVSGDGEMTAGRNLTLQVEGDYTNGANNHLRADGNMAVSATGTLTNSATLGAAGNTSVSGASIVNTATGDITATNTTITATSTLTNAGRIEGDAVQTTSANLANTGTVIGNQVQVQADDVTNAGPAALIAAAQDLKVYANHSVSNLDGATIYSAGNLQIAKDGVRDPTTGMLIHQVGTLTNCSASIESDGDIDIAAKTVQNTRTSIVTAAGTPTTASQTLTTWYAGFTGLDMQTHQSITFPSWNWSGQQAPISASLTYALMQPITVTVPKSTVTGLDTGKQMLSFTTSPTEGPCARPLPSTTSACRTTAPRSRACSPGLTPNRPPMWPTIPPPCRRSWARTDPSTPP
jgi:filamentous hemagglutinin